MHRYAGRISVIIAIACFAGCSNPEGTSVSPAEDAPAAAATPSEPQDKQPEAVAVEPDDAKSLEALAATATDLKTDDGFVVEVNFRGATIDDSALEPLAGLRRVRSVLLNDTAVTDAGMVALGKVATLQNADLRGCGISNAGLAPLASLKNLKALRLSDPDGKSTVDDEGMKHVAGMTNLKVLAVDFLWISVDGLKQLSGLKNLEELYLAKTLVDDEALAVLTQFPKLKKLRASQSQVSGAGLAELKNLPHLEDLDISECSLLADDDLAHLSGMSQLKKLNLWRDAISDQGAAHLAGLTNLVWLNVDNTQISNAALEHFKAMTKLEFLHLGSTAVSDAGLVQLEPLKALKDLKVTRTAVTEKGVEQLQKKLPDTKIQLIYIEGQ